MCLTAIVVLRPGGSHGMRGRAALNSFTVSGTVAATTARMGQSLTYPPQLPSGDLEERARYRWGDGQCALRPVASCPNTPCLHLGC